MKEDERLPFAQRIKAQAAQDSAAGLDVLSQPPPVFFQGLAALTGLRSHRENLACWERWHEALLQEQRAGLPVIPALSGWLVWGARSLLEDEDMDALFCLLLEPMYWLEKTVYEKKGASKNAGQ